MVLPLILMLSGNLVVSLPQLFLEIKTTHSAGVSRKPYESHIRQLRAYLASTNLRFGKIFYMYLGTNLDSVLCPQILSYWCTMALSDHFSLTEKTMFWGRMAWKMAFSLGP